MTLKVKNVQMVDCFDWDRLVSKTYGRPYCFQQQNDCQPRGTVELKVPSPMIDDGPDEVPEVVNGPIMGVSFAAWLARPINQPIPVGNRFLSMWWERNFYPDIQMVANDLHAKGLLPSGDYVINIDW